MNVITAGGFVIGTEYATAFYEKEHSGRTVLGAEQFENGDGEMWPFTGGIDIVGPLASRAQFLISGRYTYNMRSSRLQQLGIGPHVIRGGVGVRIRLN